MKIQIFTNLYPLPWEPNRATFNRQQFEQLAKRCGVRITVLVGWLSSFGKRNLKQNIDAGNLRVTYQRYFYIPKIAQFTHSITLAIGLLLFRGAVKRYQPDCLLLSWAFPDAVAGVVLARSLGIPAVIKVHGSDINEYSQEPLRARQIKWAMNHSAAVISVSNALSQKLVDMGISREKISTIYNGVDQSVFKPYDQAAAREELGIGSAGSLILFIGNLKLEKGCVELINSFSLFANAVPEATLCYIGSGKEAETIRSVAEVHGLQDRVKLLGSIDHAQLCKWISAATLIALPSFNEGVPNVLLEAMTCGKPVVATRVGGIPEVVKPEAGILVAAGDSRSLSEALREAIHKDWDANAIRESVAHLSWERSADEIYTLLEEVVSRANN